MENKSKFWQHVVRIKQWFKKHTYKDGRFSFQRFLHSMHKFAQYMFSLRITISIGRIILEVFYACLPFLLDLFEVLETLASTLSYNKKEIFL